MIRLSDTHALVTIDGESRVVRIPTDAERAQLRRAALRAERAARELRNAFRKLGRAAQTATYTPGDRHVNRIVQDCLDRRLDADTTKVRLIAAEAVAEVLDARAARSHR